MNKAVKWLLSIHLIIAVFASLGIIYFGYQFIKLIQNI